MHSFGQPLTQDNNTQLHCFSSNQTLFKRVKCAKTQQLRCKLVLSFTKRHHFSRLVYLDDPFEWTDLKKSIFESLHTYTMMLFIIIFLTYKINDGYLYLFVTWIHACVCVCVCVSACVRACVCVCVCVCVILNQEEKGNKIQMLI